MPKTAIIVPCYNEEKRLDAKAFTEAAAADVGLHFIFVDDGSTDSTKALLGRICALNTEQLHCISLERNQGKAEAVRTGLLKALDAGYDEIGYWDADLASPLSHIGKFTGLLESSGADAVIGSRVKLLGKMIERRTMRHYTGRLFATYASALLKIPVYDTQCGAKLFRATEDLKKAVSRRFTVKWTFDVELLARLAIIGRARGVEPWSRWIEYPLEQWRDVKGSKVRPKDFLRGGIEAIELFLLLYAPFIRGRYASAFTGK